jgi:spermidine synthase
MYSPMAEQPLSNLDNAQACFKADGWFREESVLWPGQAQSLKVKEVLLEKQTEFQHLTVFKNDGPWGNVMTLDGCIQVTDRDEFVYHEMMAHLPLSAHPNPKHVLIVGGGDGGVMREVLKHESVERCDLVDIDGAVIEESKKFFPRIAASFAHPKANAIVGDGAAFVNHKTDAYDVIIVDSSDPAGPASVLFGEEFYRNVHRALRPGGIVCSQGESVWLHLELISTLKKFFTSTIGFAKSYYGMIYIPTYPCGSIGCLIGTKSEETDPTKPIRALPAEVQDGLQYYTPALHQSAFVLPQFAAKALEQKQ